MLPSWMVDCVVLALCGLLVIYQFSATRRKRGIFDDDYDDEDGNATPEALRNFSSNRNFSIIAGSQVLQILLSGALLVLAEYTSSTQASYTLIFLLDGLYLVSLAQTIVHWTHRVNRGSRTRSILYGMSINAIITVITWFTTCPDLSLLFKPSWAKHHVPEIILGITTILQALLGLVSVIGYLSMSRRPEVYSNGNPVDRQASSSFWSVVTFSWAGNLLQLATKKQKLEYDDLPRLPHSARTKNLQAKLESALESHGLLGALLRVHYPAFLLQQLLTFTNACMSFAPQVGLLGILRSLERFQRGESDRWAPIPWVLMLGGVMVLSSFLESWLYWLVISKISIPVREQMSAVIYAKAMRCRQTGRALKRRGRAASENQEGEEESSGEASEDADLISQEKSTVNLAAVDAKRVSDEAAYNYMMTTVILKLGVACIFLVSLLGWPSTLAGLSLSMAITPINIHIGRRFTGAQARLMALRDQRATVLGEALREIRQVKLAAEENRWQTKVSIIRRAELEAQWRCFFYDICLLTICLLSPIALSVVSLGVYAVLNETLPASVAFTAIPVFGSLEMSLANLPDMVSSLMEAVISVRRIDSFLKKEERKTQILPSDNGCISFVDAAVAYPADADMPLEKRFVLHKLNMEFPSGGLSIVSGKTGSGKSLVLSTILGECDILDGAVKVPRRPDLAVLPPPTTQWVDEYEMAYVSQAPWIENTTVRENILFGLPFHAVRYRQATSDCALDQDIATFPDGDMTRIGAHGINISGGQRWRISLARALYSRARTILLDDIFSAVDAHTARHLFEKALMGSLAQNRTRILVTHHLDLCESRANLLVTLGDATVLRTWASNDKISASGSTTPTLVSTSEVPGDDDGAEGRKSGKLDGPMDMADVEMLLPGSNMSLGGQQAAEAPESDAEKRETGAVKLQVYRRYIRAGGPRKIWVFILCVYVAYMLLGLARAWWVNIWTASGGTPGDADAAHIRGFEPYPTGMNIMTTGQARGEPGHSLRYYLSVYVLISIAALVAGSARNYFVLTASIRASRELFDKLLFTVLHARMQWLSTVPIGRILNRFTVDFALVDSRLGYDLSSMLHRFYEVLSIVVSGLLASPVTAIFSLIPVAGGLYYAPSYLVAARDIKRLESTAISPVFEQLESSLAGLQTIRAYGKTSEYLSRMHALLDQHARAVWHLWLFNRWFNLRMNLVGALYCVLTACLVVLYPGMGPSVAGFTLSFTIQYPAAILWCIRQYTNVELSMNSAERIHEYESVEVEDQGGEDAPESWPHEGRIEVRGLTAGYGDLPPVLEDVSFTVQPGQRIGVVGRTGAGKSSLTLALSRFLEARSGSITIDGVDISRLRLGELRGRLQVMAQDPALFSGTIRSNLDPLGEHTDAELYSALRQAQLLPPLPPGETEGNGLVPAANISAGEEGSPFSSLSSAVAEGGSGLSAGQRQLLCLCRVLLLSRPKIVVLDEATSAVDTATDALMQRLIRDSAGRDGTTLLVIAHRLSTVVDFDAIVVMDAGRVAEYGPARELMAIEGGIFRSMVEESGNRDALVEAISTLG